MSQSCHRFEDRPQKSELRGKVITVMEKRRKGAGSSTPRRRKPSRPELAAPSEFVPQIKLHRPWLREKACVVSERLLLLHRSDASATSLRLHPSLHVEAMEIGDIEYFPAELQALALPRHFPAFAQRNV